MQDYRDEIKDFFAVDKQLASELEYDMKRYQEQLAQEQELARRAEADGAAASAEGARAGQVGGRPLSSPLPAARLPGMAQHARVSAIVRARPWGGWRPEGGSVFLCPADNIAKGLLSVAPAHLESH